MNAPAALYWYHQQPRTADYRNSSANRTGPYITELDMTGQPGVFKLVKYVPESEVAKLAAAMLAKAPPPPIVINNPDVAIVVNAAIKAEREKVAQLLAALKLARSYSAPDGENHFRIMNEGDLAIIDKAIAAARPEAVKESLTPEQRADGDAAAQLDALRDALRPFVGFSGHFEVSHQQAGGSASLHAKYSMTGRQFATACHALKQLIGDQS